LVDEFESSSFQNEPRFKSDREFIEKSRQFSKFIFYITQADKAEFYKYQTSKILTNLLTSCF